MLMSATALLRMNANPTEDEIKKGLQGNICRCTGYWNIFEAVKAAGS
jgi:aerobic-type carbon monoxide dehydrogenase small subunit (CoxS/CutS family)